MSRTDEHAVGLKGVAAVVGVGNIGSQLATHLARMPAVRGLVIVDHDCYSEGNLSSQECLPKEIGQAKAVVTARRARRIRGATQLEVGAIVARVEDVPWGRLRADVICGCVDSRVARRAISQIAWRLGAAYVDAGIQGDGMLARVEVHVPGGAAPCLECGWGARDLELMNEAYSCDGALREAAPTRASGAIGGAAASLQALECQKIFEGCVEQSLVGRQVVLEGRFHHYYVNTLHRNAGCGFDHEVWSIEKAPESVRTVGDLIEHGRKLFGGELPAAIGVDRKSWVTRLVCRACGREARVLCLQGRLGARLRCCGRCGGEMQVVGFHLRPRLETRWAGDRLLGRPLRQLGLCAGDVLTLSGERGVRHVELSAAGGN